MRSGGMPSDAGIGVPEVTVVRDSQDHRGVALTHQIVRGWHLIVVHGDLNVEDGEPLAAMLAPVTTLNPVKVIVDLARVSAINPERVHALAAANRAIRAAAGEFCLVVDGVAVLQAIRAAGLSGRFEIHRYVGDIVGAVAGLDEGGRGKRRDILSFA